MSDQWPQRVLILTEGRDEGGDFGRSFAAGLRDQGCSVTFIERNDAWPNDFDLVLAYGPFSLAGSMLPIGKKLLSLPIDRRPRFGWWLTEGLPGRSVPLRLVDWLARARVQIDQRLYHRSTSSRSNSRALWFRGHRLRILGELRWFQEYGLLDTLVVTSLARAAHLQGFGFQPIVVPLGYHPDYYGSDLNLTRDIDVAFIGQIGFRRRRRMLHRVISDLKRKGISVSVQTYLYNQDRTRFLNRTKILINILRAPQDFVGQRLLQGAATKTLIVSEPMADSAPFVTNRHFVAASIDRLADTIQYYLQHETERRRITTEAYCFVTQHLTIDQMIARILEHLRATRVEAE